MGSTAAVIEKPLIFALNGEKITIQHVDPTMTLLIYLRTQTELKGTKLGCGEGGCGACVVLVSKYNSTTRKVEEFTVNSCLALLCSLDGHSVTTIEGLGNSRDGLHAIQKRFAGFHATQCGFCTPGMCMSLYGALRSHHHDSHDSNSSPSSPSVEKLEKAISGNICRCTGYRPISDVCKSFSGTVDLEDCGLNTYWPLDSRADRELLPGYDAKQDPSFPQFLLSQAEELAAGPTLQLQCQKGEQKWIKPGSLHELFPLLKSGNQKQQEVKLVVGNTSTGVYKSPNPEFLVDISSIPELLVEQESELGIEVGAALRISRLITVLEKQSSRHSGYEKMADHLKKLASSHVRNAGSVGGNLIMSQKLGFASDIATLFLGAGVLVKSLTHSLKEVVQTMDEFLGNTLDDASVVTSFVIPAFKQGAMVFDSFRASPRPQGNSVAYVNAAFLVEFSEQGTIRSSRLAFGAFGSEHAQRAIEVEEFLKGKTLSDAVILEAVQLVKNSLTPSKGTTKAGYRSALIGSFLFKFLSSLVPETVKQLAIDGKASEQRSESFIVGKQKLQEHIQGALGRPHSKTMGELQASGEAVYVDDIPAPANCVHAAFVYSKKALAKVEGVLVDDALSIPGALDFVSVKDIPPSGSNVGIRSDLANESLFAAELVECVGQALGLMVADTQKNAKLAADKVVVKYDTKSIGPPALTVEDALAKNDLYEIPPFFQPLLRNKLGKADEEFLKATHKLENVEVNTGGQYFFYMEPQTALVLPDEDGCFTVYSSCQGPEFVQSSVAACLGIPMHNVRVITRRVGGGFGGKASKACLVAAACALAAHKLRRPVRLTLDRNTDMIMMSGRSPVKSSFSLGFDSEGRVAALKGKVFVQAGWSPEMSAFVPVFIMSSLNKFNWRSFDIDFKVCRTNTPSRTAVRGPGDTQGSFIADAIIESIASFLGISADRVAEVNFHTVESAEAVYGKAVGGEAGYTLPLVWQKLKQNAAFEKRMREVEEFNSRSLWKKRGLGICQCSYGVMLTARPGRVSVFSDGSVAVEVGGIEIGQGLWTKVKQATASCLSKVGIEVDVSRIRVVQADSISLIHSYWTGGSTTSESSCEAVRLACETLVERLKPIKEKLPEGSTWENLVMNAHLASVDLSSQTRFVPSLSSMHYINYGAAASEVEVDVLTGEHIILQSDIVYDCGKSMNPAVDIGQIEGAFVQGIGFNTCEEYILDDEGRLTNDGTWTYKPPTMDNVPRKLHVELLNSEVHKDRILSSKASGEPPLLLASSVHGALRHAIQAARGDVKEGALFQLDAPATIDKVRSLCGVENVEQLLQRKH